MTFNAFANDDLIDSLPISAPGIKYACVTDNEDHCGVFSWHVLEGDAQHNADLTGGRCVPVKLDQDGRPEIPSVVQFAMMMRGIMPYS
jgi:hypothetical protein